MVQFVGKHGVSYARTAPAQTYPRGSKHAARYEGFNAAVSRLMRLGFTRSQACTTVRRNASA